MAVKDGLILRDSHQAVVGQLLPFRHKWAWDLFLKGQANNWTPTEIPMLDDIKQWNDPGFLTDDERLVVKRCLGFFAGTESLVGGNLLALAQYIKSPECIQYIMRQVYEESLHNQTVVYVCDSLVGTGQAAQFQNELYEAYANIPSIKAKDDFLMSITTDLNRPGFDITTLSGKREYLRNLFSYYIVCEGTFFFSGFAMLLSFGRQNKLPSISQQISYTLRDESLHVEFGTRLIQNIREQNPELWDEKFEAETVEHIKTAVDLEIAYAYDVLPRGILGLNAPMFLDYVQFIANRRLEALNIGFRFDNDVNPFGWMSEVSDLVKMKNFFETRVTEYSQSGVLSDDF
jgi:ribonucleoside-diphosphate reductase beta chain